MELHVVFERVAGKMPEVRPKDSEGRVLRYTLGTWAYEPDGPGYSIPSYGGAAMEDRLIAACVRLLPGRFWHEDDGQFVVCRQDGGVLHVEGGGDSLAIAMLLAVEAIVKTPGPMPAPACECSRNPAVTDCLRVGCGRKKK